MRASQRRRRRDYSIRSLQVEPLPNRSLSGSSHPRCTSNPHLESIAWMALDWFLRSMVDPSRIPRIWIFVFLVSCRFWFIVRFGSENHSRGSTPLRSVIPLYVRLKSFDMLILPLDRFLKALGHMYLVIPVHYCRVTTTERPCEFSWQNCSFLSVWSFLHELSKLVY